MHLKNMSACQQLSYQIPFHEGTRWVGSSNLVKESKIQSTAHVGYHFQSERIFETSQTSSWMIDYSIAYLHSWVIRCFQDTRLGERSLMSCKRLKNHSWQRPCNKRMVVTVSKSCSLIGGRSERKCFPSHKVCRSNWSVEARHCNDLESKRNSTT